MAFCWAVDPSAVSAVLPSQFTGPFGALRPCRLLSLPQPVDVIPTITAVDAAAASALRTASSFTDLAFATNFFRDRLSRLGCRASVETMPQV
jgi:hypothetical protein